LFEVDRAQRAEEGVALVELYRHSIHSSMALLPIEQRVRHLSVVARTPTTCIGRAVVRMQNGFSILGGRRTVAMLSASGTSCVRMCGAIEQPMVRRE
jgi:hypothetical protein